MARSTSGRAVEILVIGLGVEIAGGDADELRARLGERRGGAVHLIAEGVHGAPEIGHFQAQNHVGVADQGVGAIGLVQRMAGGEIHAAGAADDRRLQSFGEIDQVFHAGGRAREAIGEEHRILRGHQHARGFGDGAGIALRRR